MLQTILRLLDIIVIVIVAAATIEFKTDIAFLIREDDTSDVRD